MKKFFHPFCFTITLVLCILFVELLLPLATKQWGTFWGIMATLAGVLMIVSVYIIRAIVFSSWENKS